MRATMHTKYGAFRMAVCSCSPRSDPETQVGLGRSNCGSGLVQCWFRRPAAVTVRHATYCENDHSNESDDYPQNITRSQAPCGARVRRKKDCVRYDAAGDDNRTSQEHDRAGDCLHKWTPKRGSSKMRD